jgi:hypothetical protein
MRECVWLSENCCRAVYKEAFLHMPLFLCQKSRYGACTFHAINQKNLNLRRPTKILIALRLKRPQPALAKERPLNGKSGGGVHELLPQQVTVAERAHSLN